MSSGLNKEWIHGNNFNENGYILGVCDFIKFFIDKTKKYDGSCPCRKCHNRSGELHVEWIMDHLLRYGMDKSYISWYLHGENAVVDQTPKAPAGERVVDNAEELETFSYNCMVAKAEAKVEKVVKNLKNIFHGTTQPTLLSGQENGPSVKPESRSHRESIPCKVLAHTGVLVAYGQKTLPGTTYIVNGHVMQPREAEVLIDDILDPSYPIWGGEQDGAKTLGEVVRGSYIYWHDDLLPPVDYDITC